MEEIKYTIYKLIDPTSNEIRYIGLTFNTLKQRLKSHLSENSKTHKCFWIKKLKQKNLKPIIDIIEENISSYDDACLREIYYIEFYGKTCDLTNSASGGNKNKKMSPETCKKMSDAQIARFKIHKRVLLESTKKKLSKSTKLRMKDPKEREKLRISNKKYEDSKTPEQKLNDILTQSNKYVIQYDKSMNFINEYPSIREAVRQTGIDRSNISKCCKGKVKSAGGFIWKYK